MTNLTQPGRTAALRKDFPSQFRFKDALWRTGLQFFSVPHVSIALPM
jgi:hypothetical protein